MRRLESIPLYDVAFSSNLNLSHKNKGKIKSSGPVFSILIGSATHTMKTKESSGNVEVGGFRVNDVLLDLFSPETPNLRTFGGLFVFHSISGKFNQNRENGSGGFNFSSVFMG